MRKRVVTLLVLFSTFNLFTEEMFSFTPNYYHAYEEANGITLIWFFGGEQEYALTKSDVYLEDGWEKVNKYVSLFRYWGQKPNQSVKMNLPYVIKGGNYITFFDSGASYEKAFLVYNRKVYLSEVYGTTEIISTYTYEELQKEINRPTDAVGDGWYITNFGVKSINSSSFYTEQTKSGIIEYSHVMLPYVYLESMHPEWIRHDPWVPGKANNEAGIGEYLTIEFTEPKDNVVVLNGYVDPLKRYLYKANNRVKTAVIKSLDEKNPFEIEYIFEDFVYFAEIDFPAKVSKVQFIIKDVYKGEKWNDTCVSAVLTRYEAD